MVGRRRHNREGKEQGQPIKGEGGEPSKEPQFRLPHKEKVKEEKIIERRTERGCCLLSL